MGSCPAAFVARSSPVGAMPRDVRRRSRGLALLAFCIILLSASAGFSQYNTAEISGSVRDEQGGLLPGASVVVANGAVGARLERVTDAGGRFFMPALAVGEYTLTVELSGFRRFIRSGLTLSASQKIDVPVTLQLGQLSDEITVVSDAPLLMTASAEIATTIDNRQVEQLPLNGRQFIQLA